MWMERPLVQSHVGLRQPIGHARMQIDRRLPALQHIQVKGARCAPWRKRTDAAKADPERGGGNISGHQLRDRRAARLIDLADEHQRQVHLLRLDEPQPPPVAAKCLDHPPLLAGDRDSRGISELDCGEKTQM